MVAVSLFAASDRIVDFGGADISAANTFWNVSRYLGITVYRSTSVMTGFDSRSRTCVASRGIPLSTGKAGIIIVFH